MSAGGVKTCIKCAGGPRVKGRRICGKCQSKAVRASEQKRREREAAFSIRQFGGIYDGAY